MLGESAPQALSILRDPSTLQMYHSSKIHRVSKRLVISHQPFNLFFRVTWRIRLRGSRG